MSPSSGTSRLLLPALLAAVLLCAVTTPGSAQLGFRGGVSLTDFFGDDVDNTQASQNLSYGLAVGLVRIGIFEIVAEGYYGKKGAGWDLVDVLSSGGATGLDSAQVAQLAGGASTGVVEFGLDYIEMPVMLRVNLPLIASGRIRPYVQGGPAFAWRIDCGITIDVGGSSGSEGACADLQGERLEETLRDYELGATMGGGFELRVLGGAGAITVDARLTRGLSRIQEGGNDVRNESFTAFLGYSFGFR